jgi:hypothetical protein
MSCLSLGMLKGRDDVMSVCGKAYGVISVCGWQVGGGMTSCLSVGTFMISR